MTFEQLQNLINAGFSRDDLISMGILQTTQAAPAAKPAPAPVQDPTPAPAPAPVQDPTPAPAADQEPEQPAGLNAEQALMALVTKLDARLDAIQAANITGAGMQTPDNQKTAEQILTELIMPNRKDN